MIDCSAVTLAILAGGRGSRMGQPKALLRIGEQPILQWQLARLAWPGPTLLATTPSLPRPPGSEHFDKIAVDPEDDLGPVRGILTTLQHTDTPLVAIMPVDMPNLDARQLSWLVGQCTPGVSGAMCRPTESTIVQPLPLVIHRSAATAVENVMNSPRRAVAELAKQPGFVTATAPADFSMDTWMNLNDPQALAAFVDRNRKTMEEK